MSNRAGSRHKPLIVVTGGTGFLGKVVGSVLDSGGYPGRVLDRKHSGEALDSILAALPRHQVDKAVLIHLAGLADARAAEREPTRALDEIIGITYRTVDACVRFGLGKCVIVSSAMVYGRQAHQPICEKALLNPHGVYAGAKAAAEMFAIGRVTGERLALDIVRPGNIIGPGMKQGTLIRDIVSQLGQRSERVVLQSLHTQRDYIHILDAAAALIEVAGLPGESGQVRVFNVGTGIGTSVLALYRLLAEGMGVEPTEPTQTSPCDARAFSLVLDSTLLRRTTGWEPRMALKETVRELLQTE